MPDCVIHHLCQSLDLKNVVFQGGLIRNLSGQVFPEEEELLARCVPKRRAEFVAGRTAARAALRRLGAPEQGIGRSSNRAPHWPKGFTGSITHDQAYCLAAVAHRRHFGGIGIDIEPRRSMSQPLCDLFLSDKDRNVMRSGLMLAPEDVPVAIFSAKESVYKALNPLMNGLGNPHDFFIRFSAQPGDFTAHRSSDGTSLGIWGRFVMFRDRIITCAVLPAIVERSATHTALCPGIDRAVPCCSTREKLS